MAGFDEGPRGGRGAGGLAGQAARSQNQEGRNRDQVRTHPPGTVHRFTFIGLFGKRGRGATACGRKGRSKRRAPPGTSGYLGEIGKGWIGLFATMDQEILRKLFYAATRHSIQLFSLERMDSGITSNCNI